MHDKFIDREVKPTVFKRTLKETASKKLAVEIFKPLDAQKVSLTPLLETNTKKIGGFVFYLSVTPLSGNIRQSLTPKFLSVTQTFFNMICNPKFLARTVAMLNKGQNVQKAEEFYLKNIAEKQVLEESILDKFLEGKQASEQINTLQLLRYKLISDNNVHRAKYQIDKHIEKAENASFPNKNYDLTDYHYEEKISLLNNKLLKILQNERKNISQN